MFASSNNGVDLRKVNLEKIPEDLKAKDVISVNFDNKALPI